MILISCGHILGGWCKIIFPARWPVDELIDFKYYSGVQFLELAVFGNLGKHLTPSPDFYDGLSKSFRMDPGWTLYGHWMDPLVWAMEASLAPKHKHTGKQQV